MLISDNHSLEEHTAFFIYSHVVILRSEVLKRTLKWSFFRTFVKR